MKQIDNMSSMSSLSIDLPQSKEIYRQNAVIYKTLF